MSGFFQFLSRINPQNQQQQQTTRNNNPQHQVHSAPNPSEKILSLWNAICSRTLNDTRESLNEIHQLLVAMLQIIEKNIRDGYNSTSQNPIIDTFSQHQIPKQLVTFGLANIPKGLIYEVIIFFSNFTKMPFSELLPESFIIDPLNTLIENAPNENNDYFFKLIFGLLQNITMNPDRIRLFLTSEESSPLIERFSIFLTNESYYPELGHILIRLFSSLSSVQGLMNYILTYSPLVQSIIDLCKECIEKRVVSANSAFFIECVNCAIIASPYDFQQVFAALFDESITKPLVIRADAIQSLSLSIYILCSFPSVPILVEPIFKHIIENFDLYMKSNLETIIYLTIRCITLMLEISTKTIFLSPGDKPESVKVFLGFMNLLRAEWFVKPDISKEIANSQSKVSMMMSNKNNNKNTIISKDENDVKEFEKIELVLDLQPIFSEFLLFLREKFLDSNSLRVNLALTEFFATIASIDNQEASFFALSEECQNGLVKSLSGLCTLFLRRIGQRPGTTEQINDTYKIFEGTNKTVNLNHLMKKIDGIDNNDTNEQESLFLNLIIVIEFLKELQSIAQSKNIFHQQSSIIMREYL